jgi:cyclopropane fatty-acyl-phospholipid synthase-like methyltransferase
MSLHAAICRQFEAPKGPFGTLAGWVMAHRPSNRDRNLWTVELLQLQPHHRILEIGCGPGLALGACASRLATGKAIGIDHSPTMINQASVRLRTVVAQGKVELRLGGMELLERPELGLFDRVFSCNVVQFLPDRVAAFKQVFTVLTPDGVVASTYQPRNQNPTREDALRMAAEVRSEMDAVGFVDIRTEELPLKPVPAVCVLGRRPVAR